MSNKEHEGSFLPVILGANRGAYSQARAFFEEYGVKSVVISPYLTGPIAGSQIIRHYLQKKMDDLLSFFETIHQIDQDYPTVPKIILGSDDLYVEILLRNRDLFSSDWVIPYVDRKTYCLMNNKHSFYEICEKAAVPYPQTVILTGKASRFDLPFPVIIKPSQSSLYQPLRFLGKKKVYICQTEEEAKETVRFIRENGYREELVIQEYIAGDDSCLGIVTAYVSQKDYEIKLISFGGVLLDDHTPTAIGNSLAVLVREETRIRESVRKILQSASFYGFATFDVKYDAIHDRYVFFELNARLGSSNYYVTAGGNNVARFYVEDFLLNHPLPVSQGQHELLYTILPRKLTLRMIHSAQLQEKVRLLYQKKQVVHPLAPSFENNWQRKMYIWLSSLHYYKKIRRFPAFDSMEKVRTK